MAMLKGIAHYERTHELWTGFHDDEARAETDPSWLRSKKWKGVISRHTTPGLVQTCAQLKIPLVDLNDMPLFPGVPKIRPDNVGIGHLGAEHFMERGTGTSVFAVSAMKAGRANGATGLSRPWSWPATPAMCLRRIIPGTSRPIGTRNRSRASRAG